MGKRIHWNTGDGKWKGYVRPTTVGKPEYPRFYITRDGSDAYKLTDARTDSVLLAGASLTNCMAHANQAEGVKAR